jgi:hypothetical protein
MYEAQLLEGLARISKGESRFFEELLLLDEQGNAYAADGICKQPTLQLVSLRRVQSPPLDQIKHRLLVMLQFQQRLNLLREEALERIGAMHDGVVAARSARQLMRSIKFEFADTAAVIRRREAIAQGCAVVFWLVLIGLAVYWGIWYFS